MTRAAARLAFALLATVCAAAAADPRPRFSFAAIADVQYEDRPAAGARDYRASLPKLDGCVRALNAQKLAFTIQLGDLVDGAPAALDAILPVYNRLRAPHYHVRGNHDPRPVGRPYYEFRRPGWRFIVLDGMDVSVADEAGRRLLQDLRRAGAPNATEWNGAIGEAEQTWLRDRLRAASQAGERAAVFCHFPVLAAATTPAHLLWNHEAIVRLLEESPAMAAWFNGHDHRGGYASRNGIHYVTLPGMVESGGANSFTVVDVYRDRLELRGTGTAPSRTLPLNP